MIIYLIFGQRKEQYLGQYAPEVLDAIDEYGYDENAGEWLDGKLKVYRDTDEFEKVEIISVLVPTGAIMERLRPNTSPIVGNVLKPTKLSGLL